MNSEKNNGTLIKINNTLVLTRENCSVSPASRRAKNFFGEKNTCENIKFKERIKSEDVLMEQKRQLNMNKKLSEARKAQGGTRDQPPNGGEDLGSAKNPEQLEARLTSHDFRKMQDLFKSPASNGKMRKMTRKEFVEKMSKEMRQGSKEEYRELFDKIDLVHEGFIDWDKLTSFMLLELYEKDERTKLSVLPQWKEIQFLPTIHKDAVQVVMFLKTHSSYLTISRSGLLGLWGQNLKLQRTLQITIEAVKPKDLWVTSLVALPNVNKIAVAFTSKEIYFAELNSKQGFSYQYKLQGFEGTIICMDYWYNPHDGNNAILTMGDVCGQVLAIAFDTAQISLFERPSSSPEDEKVMMTMSWQDLVSGYHKSCYTLHHRLHGKEWVRQVAYISSLDAFISVTTGSRNTLVLAWREKLSPHLTMTCFHVTQGINAFDFHSRLNLIATAGINRRVCLWNPYVSSKPAGVLEGHSDAVTAVQFIRDRKLLFSFSKDKVLRIWDIQHQLCLQRIAGSFPRSLDYHSVLYFNESHGHLFISFNNRLALLEMEQDLGNRRATSHRKAVTCVLYNSVFKQVISSDTGSTIIFWLIETGQKIKEFSHCHGNAEISTMALDGTETRLFTGGMDGTVKIWDFNGHCHHKLNAGRDRTVEISQILVLSWTILVLGWDRLITVFRLNNLTQFSVQPSEWKGGVQHQDDILCAAFLPPQTLATGSSSGEIVVWNNSTENAYIKLGRSPTLNLGSQVEQDIIPTGRLSSRRDMGSAAELASLEAENCSAITRLVFLEARNVSATGGANLISCGGAGYVRFWSTQRSRLLAEFEAHGGVGPIIMAVEKRNQYLITGDLIGWVKIWNIEDYCLRLGDHVMAQAPLLIRSFQAHEDGITSLGTCIHNGSLFVLSSSTDCSIVLSDISGVPFGIFGQERHWRIGNHVLSFPREEHKPEIEEGKDIKKNSLLPFVDNSSPPHPVEHAVPVTEAQDDSTDMINVWDNTILGKSYKEKKTQNRRKATIFNKIAGIKPTVVFRSLKIEALKEATDMSQLHSLVHPDKYFGEKSTEKCSEDLALPTLSVTLKAAFDENSLFPKEILDQGKKSRRLYEEMCNKAGITNETKQGKLKGNELGSMSKRKQIYSKGSCTISCNTMRACLFARLLLTAIGICLTRSHVSRPMADGATHRHFAVDFYHVLSRSQKSENILYSPLGVSLLLRMVHLGAKGKAHHEIGQLLRLQGNDGEDLEPLQTLLAVASEEKAFTFNLANALYLQEGFLVKEQYLHSNKKFFQSAVKLVNFQDTKASAEAISSWVEKKTDGKIKNLIASSELGPLTRLLLVNALFFKGNWKQGFRAEDTTLMTFTKGDHSIIKTPMMHLQLTTKLGRFTDHNMSYQVLELPYKGEEFSFVLILPGESVSIEEVEQIITAELIKDWFALMEEDEVEITLPRFKIEHTMDLKEFLEPLNVTEIFNNGCDLSGITDSAEVHISKAIQKVCLEVNEDGSEAAASTGMHMAVIMSLSDKRFVANRPFLFLLKHNPTESIILMGKLANPDAQLEKRRDTDSL